MSTASIKHFALRALLGAATVLSFNSSGADNLSGLAAAATCNGALPAVAQGTGGLDHRRIRVASWNVQKSANSGWVADLQSLAGDTDLLLLQEAVLERSPLNHGIPLPYASFAAGYATNTLSSGVLTLSAASPLGHCALNHREPWLQTPKATALALYPLDNGDSLLVVNLHGVNFSLSDAPLARQLQDTASLIRRHPGPVIFGGDFNTWSGSRQLELTAISEDLALQFVEFSEDRRTRAFGNPLDHILVRDLRVLESQTHAVGSSDHNPLTVTLALDRPTAL